jgi:signal transduction histidine kinase
MDQDVGLYLIRSISRPIAALRAGAQRVGSGDLTATVTLDGKDELAELAGAFNQMTADLGRNQRELLDTHRLASIGQVASGVAHEINNPLGVIVGYLKVLRESAGMADREELLIIEDEVGQCQRIVAGLLDLARPVKLDLGPVDLAEVARETVDRLAETGGLDGVRVDVSAATEPVAVRADEARVRQIVTNLLANAIDAARDAKAAGPEVRISCRRNGTRGWLEVVDRGPGVPEAVAPRLFEPFFSTKARGHGLGLAIARTLARAQDGDIEIGPATPEGTRAAVWLPIGSEAEVST